MNERLNPVQEDMKIHANATYAIGGEVARQFHPEYWKRKTQAEDLKNVKVFLQKGILNAENIEHFDPWKEDILRSIKSVLLIGGEHWAMVNTLIAMPWMKMCIKQSLVTSLKTTTN